MCSVKEKIIVCCVAIALWQKCKPAQPNDMKNLNGMYSMRESTIKVGQKVLRSLDENCKPVIQQKINSVPKLSKCLLYHNELDIWFSGLSVFISQHRIRKPVGNADYGWLSVEVLSRVQRFANRCLFY